MFHSTYDDTNQIELWVVLFFVFLFLNHQQLNELPHLQISEQLCLAMSPFNAADNRFLAAHIPPGRLLFPKTQHISTAIKRRLNLFCVMGPFGKLSPKFLLSKMYVFLSPTHNFVNILGS